MNQRKYTKGFSYFFLGIVIPCICLLFLAGIQRLKELPKVVINEICNNNFSTAPLDGRENYDWIELYNAGDTPVNLSGWSISDDSRDVDKFVFSDLILESKDYVILYASGENCVTDEGIFLNFSLSEDELLYLSDKQGRAVASVEIPKIKQNTSYAWDKENNVWRASTVTPGRDNVSSALVDDSVVKTPIFSLKGGFYSKDVLLELTAEGGCDIYYTLDGSDPTTESMCYMDPILLSDRTDDENIWASRTDFSTNTNYDDAPDEQVDKINIVRAVAVDQQGNCSEIATQSYLIGYENNPTYTDIMTVSLVSDPEYWFDEEAGLYIIGKEYEVYEEKIETEGEDAVLEDAPSPNYYIDGRMSERSAHIEVFDTEKQRILNQNVGIRVHGHTTRMMSQKSFSVYAREMYDGKDYFETDIFEKENKYPKLMIYNDRDGTKAKQKLFSLLLGDRDVATQEFIKCNMFFDGEYWGLYSLAEVYDEEYIENHYGVSADNLIISDSAVPWELQLIAMNEENLSDEEVYNKLVSKIDLESYMDYYAAMIYLDNYDWLPHNGYVWRSVNISDEMPYEDGRWRWMVYDTELCARDYKHNTFQRGNVWTWKDDPVLAILMEKDENKKYFVNTFMDMANTIFAEEYALQCLDTVLSEYSQAIPAQGERWGYDWEEDKVYTELEELKNFFENRLGFISDCMEKELGLEGKYVPVFVEVSDEAKGDVQLNSIILGFEDGVWHGYYYTDYSIALSANANNGSKFVGWYDKEGTLISEEPQVEVTLNDFNHYTAVFE